MGATQVVCARGTVDPWSPKVARAAAAAMFQIAITTGRTLIDAIAGTEVRITSGNAELRIQDVDWTLPSTLVVGNEANGVGADWSDLDTEAVSIPMAGDVESLNAGVAASIVLYEALRQRTA
jgi:TrmH family RNA methyltransferase